MKHLMANNNYVIHIIQNNVFASFSLIQDALNILLLVNILPTPRLSLNFLASADKGYKTEMPDKQDALPGMHVLKFRKGRNYITSI